MIKCDSCVYNQKYTGTNCSPFFQYALLAQSLRKTLKFNTNKCKVYKKINMEKR